MYTSIAEGCAKAFKQWSDTRLPAGNDNNGGDVPIGAAVAVADGRNNYDVAPKAARFLAGAMAAGAL